MKALRYFAALAAAALLAPAAAFCAASALGQSRVLNRLVTPNGDGLNDTFVFRCHNPRDSGIDAKIFDLAGREIAVMRVKNIGTTDFYYDYEWNPNASGKAEGGVYIYQVRVETKVYKGTVIVIR
ncbi:MAG: gliding motility-associated C-terminal domain-containing protein [Elusimicrobiales bacterium]|nr:gliding motility-associated C-terminal domain-containing protein [Elusimicrobiales bacterium]